ncbi:hypothetical protein ABZX92_39650 [Lentzea sp. NPDC006480]|uniref:hypothetical protein n=1 Tax=Lentzea sp. NPDC006480 TaxID=3157176 RepID=UPI0033B646F7
MSYVVRAVTALLVGALCGAGCYWSPEPIGEFLCGDRGENCFVAMIVLGLPALVMVWGVVAWGLLRLVRFSRAGATAALGTVGAMPLAPATASLFQSFQVRVQPDRGMLVVAIAAACGYVLAAAVTTGYGVWRDRTSLPRG